MQQLDLQNTRISAPALENLVGLRLSKLVLPAQVKTDVGLRHYLAAIAPAAALHLRDWKITDAGLVHLKGRNNLRKLDLERTQITAAGLAQLAGLQLDSLLIPYGASTDQGLKHYLGALAAPTSLNLNGWQVSDAGLRQVAGLTELRRLTLRRTSITDAAPVSYTHLRAHET